MANNVNTVWKRIRVQRDALQAMIDKWTVVVSELDNLVALEKQNGGGVSTVRNAPTKADKPARGTHKKSALRLFADGKAHTIPEVMKACGVTSSHASVILSTHRKHFRRVSRGVYVKAK